MCGFFGVVHPGSFDATEVGVRLKKVLSHRGPDAQADWQSESVYFYHARLSIQDIEGGQQPMHLGDLSIIFNGEIYNHLDLRQRFGLEGHTRSDTETLLLLYEKLGPAAFEELDGMFALAIWDAKQKMCIFARDRAGEKPLYFMSSEGELTISSELNALYACASKEPTVSQEALFSFLHQGFLCGTETPFQEVYELLPGHWATFQVGQSTPRIQPYFEMRAVQPSAGLLIRDEKQALQQLDRLLSQSVTRQLTTSDIEVGTFLSGGIDSGLVTALACKKHENLQTFTVCFDGAYDEGPLAKQTAEWLGTRHHELPISFESLQDDIFQILGAYGEPFADDSAIPSWYVTQAAKEHLTVILTGDGADELFGGYRRYVPQRYVDLYQAEGNAFTRWTAKKTKVFARNKKSRLNYAYRLLNTWNQPLVETYLSSTTDVFAGDYRQELLQEPLNEELLTLLQTNALPGIPPLSRALLYDFNVLLPGVLLPKMDIAAMQHSLETRAPFLGKDLLNFAPKLAPELKIKGITTKYLLRKLAEKYLPKPIVGQPKRGFEIPLKSWMQTILYSVVADLVNSDDALTPTLIKQAYIQRLLNWSDKNIPAEIRAKQLFTILGLEIWQKHLKTLR